MNLVSVPWVDSRGEASGAGSLLKRAVRRIFRSLPASWRAALLLSATVVFFPVIVGIMIVASVVEDLPLAYESQDVPRSQDAGG
jgi:hypothetical protein